MISFTVPGNPVPWERVRTNGAHHTPPRTRAWQTKVKVHALKAIPVRDRCTRSRVSIRLRFWRETRQRCDWDNLAKSVCDALNGIAWEDDSQIDIALITRGHDPAFPRVEIEITPHDEPNALTGHWLPEVE